MTVPLIDLATLAAESGLVLHVEVEETDDRVDVVVQAVHGEDVILSARAPSRRGSYHAREAEDRASDELGRALLACVARIVCVASRRRREAVS